MLEKSKNLILKKLCQMKFSSKVCMNCRKYLEKHRKILDFESNIDTYRADWNELIGMIHHGNE